MRDALTAAALARLNVLAWGERATPSSRRMRAWRSWRRCGLLIADIRQVALDEPPERVIPTHHIVADILQAQIALARPGVQKMTNG